MQLRWIANRAYSPNWRLITVTLKLSNLEVFSIGVSKTRVFAGMFWTTGISSTTGVIVGSSTMGVIMGSSTTGAIVGSSTTGVIVGSSTTGVIVGSSGFGSII